MWSEKNYSQLGKGEKHDPVRVLRIVADVCTVLMCISSIVIAITLLVIGVKVNGEFVRLTRLVVTEQAVSDVHSLLHETSSMAERAAAADAASAGDDQAALGAMVRELAGAATEAMLAIASAARGLRGETLDAFLSSISSPEFKVASYSIISRALDDFERVQNALGFVMTSLAKPAE